VLNNFGAHEKHDSDKYVRINGEKIEFAKFQD
jgi:hypothetical protein